MLGKDLIPKHLLAAAVILLSGCDTVPGQPEHLFGVWGGPHAGAVFQGGLADVQFECASATIDNPVYPAADGTFAVKGTYRTGTSGPIKVGEYFKSEDAMFSGQVTKGTDKKAPRVMTLNVILENGSSVGTFTLTEGTPPQLAPPDQRACHA